MKRIGLAALLLMGLLLAACAPAAETVTVWYAVADPELRETVYPVEIAVPEGETPLDTARRALFIPPEDDVLYVPIPQGVGVRSLTLEDGLLTLDLSGPYGELAGMGLTTADACIVLTMTQLPEVEAVCITVYGKPVPAREEQVLTADDFLYEIAPAEESAAETPAAPGT